LWPRKTVRSADEECRSLSDANDGVSNGRKLEHLSGMASAGTAPLSVTLNTAFIVVFALGAGATCLIVPSLVPRVLDGASFADALKDEVAAPWVRTFGAQAVMIGMLYLFVELFSRPSRTFTANCGVLRLVWSLIASAVIVFHGGPWFVLALILLGDFCSGVHLLWAVSHWERPRLVHKPDGRWRGPYMAGMFHFVLSIAVGVLVFIDPFIVASLFGVLTKGPHARLADVQTPDSLQDQMVWGQLYAAFSLVTGLFFARHGPDQFVASVGSRLAMLAAVIVGALLAVDVAQPASLDDTLWLVAPAIVAAIPSFLSVPLTILEHYTLSGTADVMTAVEDERKEKHVD
jgi:hypothetical protein